MSQDKAKQDEGLPLVQRSFDLCVELYTHVNRFPRAHKPLLGRDILSAAQQMFVGLVMATRRRDRLPVLEEADLHLGHFCPKPQNGADWELECVQHIDFLIPNLNNLISGCFFLWYVNIPD
ncbi:MAG: hypothetical protein HY202_01375 [Nitrospirae bacterium]|nr:hypothetical protein [Nitrospirota bacterium]